MKMVSLPPCTRQTLLSVVELVNTEGCVADVLSDRQSFLSYCERFGYETCAAGSLQEINSVRLERGRMRDLLLAKPHERVCKLNRVLAGVGGVPQLVRHEGDKWHLHILTSDDSRLATRLIAAWAGALMELMAVGESNRIAACGIRDCMGVALDLSRNRSRIYCSTTCGNRNIVAAYRLRHARDRSTRLGR